MDSVDVDFLNRNLKGFTYFGSVRVDFGLSTLRVQVLVLEWLTDTPFCLVVLLQSQRDPPSCEVEPGVEMSSYCMEGSEIDVKKLDNSF